MINHKHKFIFIHIPKTGGTSVDEFFTGKMQKHACMKDYIDNLGSNLVKKYFKFCIVRNPWDKTVSHHTMINNRILEGHPKTVRIYGKKIHPFKEYVVENMGMKDRSGTEFETKHSHDFDTMDQLNWISDFNGNICIDYIMRLENMQQYFNIICDKIGIPRQQLPHENKTKHKHYTEYYDDETREIVAEQYEKDIEYFGYKFGE